MCCMRPQSIVLCTVAILAAAATPVQAGPELCTYPPCVTQSLTVDNGNVHASAGERVIGNGAAVSAGPDGVPLTVKIGFRTCHADVEPDGTITPWTCAV